MGLAGLEVLKERGSYGALGLNSGSLGYKRLWLLHLDPSNGLVPFIE